MAHLTFTNYPGVGERHCESYHYSQAVRVGNIIDCAGQGGWNPETGEVSSDLNKEVEQAFQNVDMNLKVCMLH